MEDYLPKESGRYLKVILGNLNVSILDRDTKCNYKEQYEQFKLTINIIGIWFYINLIRIIFFLQTKFFDSLKQLTLPFQRPYWPV